MPVTVRLTQAQVAALECAGLELSDEPGDLALLAAWRGRRLVVDPAQAAQLRAALTEAANAEDYLGERGDRAARGAALALGNLAAAVSRAVRHAT